MRSFHSKSPSEGLGKSSDAGWAFLARAKTNLTTRFRTLAARTRPVPMRQALDLWRGGFQKVHISVRGPSTETVPPGMVIPFPGYLAAITDA